MKKIILTALTVLMMFGLIGCNGVLHDTPVPVNEPVKIANASWFVLDINVWGDNTDKAQIIISGDDVQSGDTKLPAYKAAEGAVFYYTMDKANKELKVSYQEDEPKYEVVPGVVRIYVYTNISVPKAWYWDGDFDAPTKWPGNELETAVEAGTPFYLHGFFFSGKFNAWEEGGKAFTQDGKSVLSNPTTDLYGNVEYTYNFIAQDTKADYGICNNGWQTKYTGSTFTVGTDTDFVKTTLGADANNIIKGLKIGSAYRLVVKTTPAGDVYVKAFEIAKATVKFEVTGLSAGNEAWMNGTFWGSDWPQGWPAMPKKSNPSENWGTPKDGFVAAVAGVDGVATFDEKWNITVLAALGETKSYEFKAIACEDSDWASEDDLVLNPASNLKADIKLTKSGTYTVSVAKDGTVTVKNPQ